VAWNAGVSTLDWAALDAEDTGLKYMLQVVLWVALASGVFAQDSRKVAELAKALGLPAVIMVMHDEGLGYGDELASELFPDHSPADWKAAVSRIYSYDWMLEQISAGLVTHLQGADVDAMTEFFTTEPGHRIARLEVSARQALVDKGIEAVARERYAIMLDDGDPRLELIGRYAEANDLIELNVVSALNSNLAFYRGMSEGGGFPTQPTEDEVFRDVWGQEDSIRLDTEQWLFGFLTLAYQPLSDDELETYIAFSETVAGQDMNQALFSAFDEMFAEISYRLGLAAGKILSGEDI